MKENVSKAESKKSGTKNKMVFETFLFASSTLQNVTARRLNSPRLRGITNQHSLTDYHSNLINRRGLKTETSK